MDYKKSKAPVNTVTRNIMDLCDETGNIYESVAIISKRANQIAVEIKQDLNKNWQSSLRTTTLWKRSLRTASRLRFLVIMKSCRSLLCWLHRNLSRAIFIIVILQRTTRIDKYVTA